MVLPRFPDGERDFEDEMTVEEYVVPVTVHPDGVLVDEHGNGPGTDGGSLFPQR
jgi:hypothetical protein